MIVDPETEMILRVAAALERHGIPFMFLGGLEPIHPGESGVAVVGLVLGASPAGLTDLLELCRQIALVPLPDDPDRYAREKFLLPTRDVISGQRCDFLLSAIPYQRQAIGRAVRRPVNGVEIPFATPEDQIIHWLFAEPEAGLDRVSTTTRPRDTGLDWDYLEAWARAFATVPGREQMPEQVLRLRAALDHGAES